MKLFKIFIVPSLFFIVTIGAQKNKELFVPYYISQDSIKHFERVSAKPEFKTIGFGYGGSNQYLTVFNKKHSSTRFKKNKVPKFYIKIDDNTDPFELVVISKADKTKKRKKYRRFIKKGYNMGGGSKNFDKLQITPTLKKIKDNEYLILIENLEVGEYAFMPIYKGIQSSSILSTSGNVRIYCFGIDE